MRRAHRHEALMDGDTFIGVNLGADFTAEHEWGISDIREQFGMKDDKDGIDRRTATRVPKDSIRLIKGKKHPVLLFDHRLSNEIYRFSEYVDGDKFKKELEDAQEACVSPVEPLAVDVSCLNIAARVGNQKHLVLFEHRTINHCSLETSGGDDWWVCVESRGSAGPRSKHLASNA